MSSASPSAAADTADMAATAGLVTARGETMIAPAAVESIASRAATEVDGVRGVVRTGLGRLLPWVSSDAPPQADADVDRDSVAVDLTLNVRYPEPVAKITRDVRQHVVERLAALTGLSVTEVNITVEDLVVEQRRGGRRVQ